MRRKRNEFSARTKRIAKERAGGFCEAWIADIGRCNAPLIGRRFIYEHLDPEWISGKNDLGNCGCYCLQCAKIKTRRDMATIAKVKRIIKKRAGKRSRRRIRGSKRFDGSPIRYD